jgi:PAS domain-containing protein
VEFPVFLFAIAITVWYARMQAAVSRACSRSLGYQLLLSQSRFTLSTLRVLNSRTISFSYYLRRYWFTAVRRRAERELLQTRDELEREVVERTQQASLLDLTHDSIFVRGIDDVITFWNRGAEELYGWRTGEVIGKITTHRLLQTVFPAEPNRCF